jgi:TPR repeat protein
VPLPNWLPTDRVQTLFSPKAAIHRAALTAAGKPGPAFRVYARAALNGLTEADYRVGRCYLEGAGVPLSRAEGVRWLEWVGRHPHAEAQSLLAILYLHGMMPSRYLARSLAGERDPERARYWLERALAQGQTEAAEDLTALPEGLQEMGL